MSSATTTRMTARVTNGSDDTSSSAMTMISAERMRSVRIAPETIACSCSGPTAATGSACPSWWESFSQTFSAPSYARYVPPSMRIGVSSHGRNWLSSNAIGRMMSSLLRIEPMAIFLTMGSSRSGLTPST